MLRLIRPPVLAALAIAVAGAAPAASQDLPPAQEIIDRYVEAIGGRDAAVASVVTRSSGSFAIPAMGVTGDLESVETPEGATAMRVTIPGMGDMLSGYTGEVGWSTDPMTGPRLLDGGELDAMREQAHPLYAVRDASLFESFETIGEDSYDGEECWNVRFVWISGRETTECFSKESGLVIAQITAQESPMGTVEVTSRFSDYQRFGDVLVATTVRQSMMGQEQVLQITEVEFGDVDQSLLEVPEAIKTLIQAGN